ILLKKINDSSSPPCQSKATSSICSKRGTNKGVKTIGIEVPIYVQDVIDSSPSPDHLAALTRLSIGWCRVESALVGALWGCRHGQVIFGLLFLVLKGRLHIEIKRAWATRVVCFTLLVIGAMGIHEASEVPAPCVALENGKCDVSVYEASLADPT
nr:nickel/cobalt transporter, high-affinity [Tanacetum cinerariifolium]